MFIIYFFWRKFKIFNQDAFATGFQAGGECGEDYPAEYRKNIEEIFPISYETGLFIQRASLTGQSRRLFFLWIPRFRGNKRGDKSNLLSIL
ncbi:MAG: hypothetical protein COV72_00245 [Candidatus Omnitrophica bacterium CG11_big_fil_rev_8_21_14_0_20_42_13]|uniref:Uncharacterized protein n=1 Tax=Candidatus Ghiorseimicrobium undicola TaxID=1974746 RepID=A0A2H0M011_9BACT|nr:MAG: hypothetical protein COV72_00245 [Candidatus Omnitrophica bacterium CG11_big_fil_rev_8_21_14_0_20_42_13]